MRRRGGASAHRVTALPFASMQRSLRLGVLATLLLLTQAGCGDRPAASGSSPATDAPPANVAPPLPAVPGPDPKPEMFFGLPVVPGSRIVAGTDGAAEALIQVSLPADSLARVYRRVLVKQSWEIRGDATAADGSVTLHARSAEGRPIWIMIRPLGPGHSEVSLIATAVDSAAAPR